MRKSLAFLLISFTTYAVYAQQEPIFTMFWNQYSFFNPAASGLFNEKYASLTFRNQLSALYKNPKTLLAVYDHRFDSTQGGIGISYMFDKIGFEQRNEFKLNYARYFKLGEEAMLSIGASLSYERKSITYSSMNPLDPNDPSIPASDVSDNFINIGLGAMYNSPKLVCGISVTNLNQPPANDMTTYNRTKNFHANISYLIDVKSDLQIKPGIYYRSDFSYHVTDWNVMAYIHKKYWAGVTYRKNIAMGYIFGMDLKENYRVSYSYDNSLVGINGSHEFALVWMVGK